MMPVKAMKAPVRAKRSKAEMQQEGERIRKETTVAIGKLEQQAAFEIESAGKLAQRELKEYAAGLALDLAEQRIHWRSHVCFGSTCGRQLPTRDGRSRRA